MGKMFVTRVAGNLGSRTLEVFLASIPADQIRACFSIAKRIIERSSRISPRAALACAVVLVAGLTPAVFGATGGTDPVGNWRVSDGADNIRIADCNGVMWGVVSWEKVPEFDKNNPDISKRIRPLLGMPTLLNLKKSQGADHWEGQVYNSKNGKTYKSTMKLLSPDKLEVKGCVFGFLCGGDTWTRIAPSASEATAVQSGFGVADVCRIPEIASHIR